MSDDHAWLPFSMCVDLYKKTGHGCDLRPRLADVNALDPPTERVRSDRVRERTTDVHTGAPVGQPPPRHVPGDVNVDLSPGPGIGPSP